MSTGVKKKIKIGGLCVGLLVVSIRCLLDRGTAVILLLMLRCSSLCPNNLSSSRTSFLCLPHCSFPFALCLLACWLPEKNRLVCCSLSLGCATWIAGRCPSERLMLGMPLAIPCLVLVEAEIGPCSSTPLLSWHPYSLRSQTGFKLNSGFRGCFVGNMQQKYLVCHVLLFVFVLKTQSKLR